MEWTRKEIGKAGMVSRPLAEHRGGEWFLLTKAALSSRALDIAVALATLRTGGDLELSAQEIASAKVYLQRELMSSAEHHAKELLIDYRDERQVIGGDSDGLQIKINNQKKGRDIRLLVDYVLKKNNKTAIVSLHEIKITVG